METSERVFISMVFLTIFGWLLEWVVVYDNSVAYYIHVFTEQLENDKKKSKLHLW